VFLYLMRSRRMSDALVMLTNLQGKNRQMSPT
jgi:hypothetical protein